MKITVVNKKETGVTIKETHITFTKEIPPDDSKTIDTDGDSYAVSVTYYDSNHKEQTKKTSPLTGNSIVTLIRQHNKEPGLNSKDELHLIGTKGGA